MIRFLFICLGGAAGSGARYLLILWAAASVGASFPVGTFLVNVIGSFLVAFVMHVGTATALLSEDARLALTTGLLGGFTTYSTFNYETTSLLRSGAWLAGSLNVIVTVLACLAAGLFGFGVARLMVGR